MGKLVNLIERLLANGEAVNHICSYLEDLGYTQREIASAMAEAGI